MRAIAVRFAKFGTVGFSGVLVNAGILYALTERAGWDYRISSLIAIQVAILNNFLWNGLWTWRDRSAGSRGDATARLVKFNVSSALVAIVVNWGILVTLTQVLHLHYQISNLTGIAVGTVLNFLISHHWTFKLSTPEGSGD